VVAKVQERFQPIVRELASLVIQAADASARLRVAEGIVNKALEKTIEYEKGALRNERRQAEVIGDESKIAEVDRSLIALTAELHQLRSRR
jgi:hypothetical protein